MCVAVPHRTLPPTAVLHPNPPTTAHHSSTSAIAVTVIDVNIMRLIKAKILESKSNNQEAFSFNMIRV